MRAQEQSADVLTKGLSKQVFQSLVSKLGMIDIFELAWQEVSKINFQIFIFLLDLLPWF